MSSYQCCFERLGISCNSTEQEIKKAYRRLALQTHPDKVPPQHQEQATTAFRELYDAYMEAMERVSSCPQHNDSTSSDSTTTPPPQSRQQQAGSTPADTPSQPQSSRRKKTRAPTDNDIKKAFNDVCDHLDRELREWHNTSWNKIIRKLEAAWPTNKEQCWNAVVDGPSLSWDIEKLTQHFEQSLPDLAVFLKKRQAQRDAKIRKEMAARDLKFARRIEMGFPEEAGSLKIWAKKEWLLVDYDDIADKVCNAAAASTIRAWKKERSAEMRRSHRARRIQSANKIVRVFPDKQKIAEILKSHCSFERPEIYDLLPDEIRNTVAATGGTTCAIREKSAKRSTRTPQATPSNNGPSATQATTPVAQPFDLGGVASSWPKLELYEGCVLL